MKPGNKGFAEDPEDHHGTLTTYQDGNLNAERYSTVSPPTYVEYYRMFAKALKGESEVPVKPEDARDVLRIIEAAKESGSADREQARLKDLMERMSVSPSTQASGHSQSPIPSDQQRRPPPLQNIGAGYSASSQQPSYAYNPARSPPISPGYPNGPPGPNYQSFQQNGYPDRRASYGYNPNNYGPVSPPAHQQYFSPPPAQFGGQQPTTTTYGALPQQSYSSGQNLPAGWQPPPPPPGPPPQQDYSAMQATNYPSGPGGYASDPRRSAPQGGGDPWAGLSNWK